MTQRGSNKKVANKLVAASCAAVLAVYVAGYARTQSAADRLARQIATERKAERLVAQPATFPYTKIPTTPSVPPEALSPAASASPKLKVDREPTPIPAAAAVSSAAPETSSVDLATASNPVVAEHQPEVTAAVSPAVLPAESAPAPAKPAWKDGVYTGWGYSRHGNIEAAVVIESGRIASATISQCRTRYSCSVIDKLPPQVAQRQGPDVDYVSGATESADAFYGAVAEALSKAK